MIASVTYTTSGSAGPYTITFPFISTTDLRVYLDGVANTAFSVVGTSLTLNTAPTATAIEIRRATQSAAYVDFTDPAPIAAADLDTATLQAIYIAQEAVDVATNRLPLNATLTAWDAGSKKITNVTNPTLAQDAATKAYADSLAIAAGNVVAPTAPEVGDFLKATAVGTWAWDPIDSTDITDATVTGKSILTAVSAAAALDAIGGAKALHVHPHAYGFVPVRPAAAVLPNPIVNQVFGG